MSSTTLRASFGDSDFAEHLDSTSTKHDNHHTPAPAPNPAPIPAEARIDTSCEHDASRDDDASIHDSFARSPASDLPNHPAVAHLSKSEQDRIVNLVTYFKSRVEKLEGENTGLKVELANTKFELESSRLELRQMTTKREGLARQLDAVAASKAKMTKSLVEENSDMIHTIDKLESERDALNEEVAKLKGWIMDNKGSGDGDVVVEERGVWTGGSGVRKPSALVTRVAEKIASLDDDNATCATADSTVISESPSFGSTASPNSDAPEDKLYSDEFLNSVVDDEEDDDDNIFADTIEAGQSTGQQDSGDIDTASKTGDVSNKKEKKAQTKKKKIFGVSVKPRR